MDKKIKTEKKPWQKPELVILARSKPEEAVLRICKQDAASNGAGKKNKGCFSKLAGTCSACDTGAGS